MSSFDGDFNYDFGVSFTPEEMGAGTAVYNYVTRDPYLEDREGVSVFYQDASGQVFHTYSSYARGIDMLNGAYHFLDLVPKGRDETGRNSGCVAMTSSERRSITSAARWALPAVAAGAAIGALAVAYRMGNGPGTMGLDLAGFIGMWSLMMAAMMLPSIATIASPAKSQVYLEQPTCSRSRADT